MLQSMNVPKHESRLADSGGAHWVADLRRRFEARGVATQLIETHISWVVLAGHHAFKIKKPVNLGFLDFATLSDRQRFCLEEVRLNRRLAPQWYLGVQAMRAGPKGVALAGSGPVVEYAVRMRRMSAGSLASDCLRQGRLTLESITQLAAKVADFHEDVPRAALHEDWGRPSTIVGDALRVLQALAPYADAQQCARLQQWCAQQAQLLYATWQARRAAGFVRECHGDLHLGNVVLEAHDCTAFDCIEFDPALRWTDVMSDVAFLVMDLQAHGRRDLAYGFLDAYLECTGDFSGLAVLRFYMVYRAMVRALVGSLDASSGGVSATVYLDLAIQLTEPTCPSILISHGLPGSGKTFLTGALLRAVGAVRVRSDVERKRLAGLSALADSHQMGDLYRPCDRAATYDRLWALTQRVVQAGWICIIDAAFLQYAHRSHMRALAHALSVPFVILDCAASLVHLHERVHARQLRRCDASEADDHVLDVLLPQSEALTEAEMPHVIQVMTDQSYDIHAIVTAWQAMIARR